MESELPDWIKILSALLTLVLSIVVTSIIVFQYILQKYRWRLDLFDKRYEIYNNTMKFISFIVQHRKVTDEQLFDFIRETKDRDFLFGEEIHGFLDQIYNKGNDFNYLYIILKSEPVGKRRDELVNNESEIFKWFSNQFNVSKKLFGKYLEITKK